MKNIKVIILSIILFLGGIAMRLNISSDNGIKVMGGWIAAIGLVMFALVLYDALKDKKQ